MHRRTRNNYRLRYAIASMVAALGLLFSFAPWNAGASVSPGNAMLNAAETRTGDWYVYGAAGPSTFDCSGLVVWSAHQIGISLLHSTYSMPSSPVLYRVYTPQRGDLAFYGSGHVEIVTAWWHTTFGAQQSGTRVGWHTWNAYWHPTMYFRVR